MKSLRAYRASTIRARRTRRRRPRSRPLILFQQYRAAARAAAAVPRAGAARVGQQLRQRRSARPGSRGGTSAGDPVVNGVQMAAHRRGHHGLPAGHGLHRHDAERLVPGGGHHDVRRSQQGGHVPGVRHRAGEADPVRHAARWRRPVQPGTRSSSSWPRAAGDDQFGARHSGDGLDDGVVALAADQPAQASARCRGARPGGTGPGPEAVAVDPARDHVHGFRLAP